MNVLVEPYTKGWWSNVSKVINNWNFGKHEKSNILPPNSKSPKVIPKDPRKRRCLLSRKIELDYKH